MEPTEGYEVIGYIPAKSLMYNQPGTCYTLVALPEEDPTAGDNQFSAYLLSFSKKICTLLEFWAITRPAFIGTEVPKCTFCIMQNG